MKPQCKLVLYVLSKATGIAKFLLSWLWVSAKLWDLGLRL